MGVSAGVKEEAIFCGHHNCTLPVPVLWCHFTVKQPSSLLSICTLKTKSNSKHFKSSKMAPKRTITYLYSSKYYCGNKKLKTCQERPHLWSFYKGDL